eukprot:15444981-Alexandrium_andersonii.AAC.1
MPPADGSAPYVKERRRRGEHHHHAYPKGTATSARQRGRRGHAALRGHARVMPRGEPLATLPTQPSQSPNLGGPMPTGARRA